LPHLERIQRAFGPRYDLSSVRAHLDERSAAASRSIRAAAYTIGDAVAFDGWPDPHTAVHEAAHVVQQRRGVSLPGGVSREHDLYEQHANAIADAGGRRAFGGTTPGRAKRRFRNRTHRAPAQDSASAQGRHPVLRA
jgi:hypothetical protein